MNPAIGYTAIVGVAVASALIGFYGLRVSRTTSDFYVASRTVRPWWNASAIGGEYLSAASFLGIAGLVLLTGSAGLWFPIGYTAGYLMLLLFVAAPLRRSGAYTIPDFTEARLESVWARRVTSTLVIVIGWFYIVPQLQGAALTVRITTGLPAWAGSLAVAVIVAVVVAAGGMRSITFVQAFQFWLKLTALAVPVVVLLVMVGGVEPELPPIEAFPAAAGPADLDVYRTVSLMVALLLGTLGLPHVLVRFYTNPDGTAARRTTVIVLVLLSVFYLFPTAFGFLGRAFAPDLAASGEADALVLLLPGRLVPGPVGDLLTAFVIAGAFAAFLSTSSGLVVSLAGVISQDLIGGSVRGFRIAAVASSFVPLLVALATESAGLAGSVGLVFAFTASTLCPMLLLGIWWRGLTARGAIAGMLTGAVLSGSAIFGGSLLATAAPGIRPFLEQPAAWTVPLAVLVTVLASRADRRGVPRGADAFLTRLHVPEAARRRREG
ncbi:MAG: cation acetate symporter [Agromyces sp.]|nr:cation acetate symporter [Agromyces sp.]